MTKIDTIIKLPSAFLKSIISAIIVFMQRASWLWGKQDKTSEITIYCTWFSLPTSLRIWLVDMYEWFLTMSVPLGYRHMLLDFDTFHSVYRYQNCLHITVHCDYHFCVKLGWIFSVIDRVLVCNKLHQNFNILSKCKLFVNNSDYVTYCLFFYFKKLLLMLYPFFHDDSDSFCEINHLVSHQTI